MRRRMLMGKKEPITVTLYGADNDTITISEGSTTLQSVTLSGASGKATIANGEGTYTFKSANTSYSTTVAVVNGSSVNVGATYTISITLKGANNDNIRIRRTGVSDKWVTLSGTSGSVSYSMVGQSSGSMEFYSSVSGYSVTATVGNGNTITLYPSTAIYWYGNEIYPVNRYIYKYSFDYATSVSITDNSRKDTQCLVIDFSASFTAICDGEYEGSPCYYSGFDIDIDDNPARTVRQSGKVSASGTASPYDNSDCSIVVGDGNSYTSSNTSPKRASYSLNNYTSSFKQSRVYAFVKANAYYSQTYGNQYSCSVSGTANGRIYAIY